MEDYMFPISFESIGALLEHKINRCAHTASVGEAVISSPAGKSKIDRCAHIADAGHFQPRPKSKNDRRARPANAGNF
jgi:hypothetical protein